MRDMARTITRAVATLLLLAGAAIALAAPPAGAQSLTENRDAFETCALYQPIVTTGGQRALDNIAELRDFSPSNPPGVDDAFDVLVAFEDENIEDPANEEIEAAYDILDGYYGTICDQLDLCPLTNAINAGSAADRQQAAEWLLPIASPMPAGIGAALSVLAGQSSVEDTAGLVESEAAARTTVLDWFGDDSCRLAMTGPSATLSLTAVGLGIILVGGALVGLRRYQVDRTDLGDLNW